MSAKAWGYCIGWLADGFSSSRLVRSIKTSRPPQSPAPVALFIFHFSFFISHFAFNLSAEDRVVLQPDGRYSNRLVLRGEIEDYTGRTLTLRVKTGGPPRSYPAEQVLEVETVQTEPHQAGLAHFNKREIPQAEQSLEQALDQDERAWVRREILAALVRCALYRGDYRTAGQRFLPLVQSDPATRFFPLIPLAWGGGEVSGPLRAEATNWLSSDVEPSQLMGASFLLDDAQRRTQAAGTLGGLASSGDARVRVLAQAQLWRGRLAKSDFSPLEIPRWQARIAEMPEDLRGGPYYVLGRAYLLRREPELAASAFLWLPLVYDQDRYLAARSCLQAAGALASIGQKQVAVRLYGEVLERFEGTQAAGEARQLIERPQEESEASER